MIDYLCARENLDYSLQFISEPWKRTLAIHPEIFCGDLFDNDFMPNIDSALLQDQYRPLLRCDVFRFWIMSISRQLTV
jgi:hypothetical protein